MKKDFEIHPATEKDVALILSVKYCQGSHCASEEILGLNLI
jgi:hypothetical protein